MSKIQFNELNQLEVLNREETTSVVGGVGDFFNFKGVVINQNNANLTIQNAQSGFSFSNGNSNSTSQGNLAIVNQVG